MATRKNPQATFNIENMDLHKVEYQRTKDGDEKALRPHKERLNFSINEMGTYVFGFVFLAAAAVYCFWVLQ